MEVFLNRNQKLTQELLEHNHHYRRRRRQDIKADSDDIGIFIGMSELPTFSNL